MLKRVLVLALAVAGCGGSSATAIPTVAPQSEVPEVTAAATPTQRPTEQPPSPGCGPSASLVLVLACTQEPEPRELPAPVTELEAWTYVKSDFTPKITFSVGRGWTAAQATTGFFDIQDKPGDLDVVAVQFGNVTEADTAAEAAANVRARQNLAVSEPEEVTIGGYEGVHLVVETTDPLDLEPVVFHPVIELKPGDVSIATARRLDLNLLDVDGQVLAIMVGGSIAKWDRAERLGGSVVETVQIGD